jgi:TPR repeat protein
VKYLKSKQLSVMLAVMTATAATPASAQLRETLPRPRQITGSPVQPDMAQLRARAEAGDLGAQNDLGIQLLDTSDPALAAEARLWFRRAADAGDAEAMNNLATTLLIGAGGPPDEAQGRRLRDEAARQGSVGANMAIADRYLEGSEGYPRDPVRAFEHMRAAAASPLRSAAFAQWRLGMMHLEGVGTPRDSAAAYRIFVAASERGGVRAMISRAVMLATGDGVAEDDAAARLWYQRAAESAEYGFEHALRALGGMLLFGEGGPADLPRAVAYLRIAQAARDEPAGRILAAIATRITPETDREARQIAEQWMRLHLPGN